MGKISTISGAKHVKEGVQLFKNRKTLTCMLREVWKGRYKMSFATNLFLILGIVYVVTPFDFDWIPFIGWIDDIAVVIFLIKRLQKETQRFNRHKAMERKKTC